MSNDAVFQDPTRSAAERADDLLSRMTLDEKLAQIGSYYVYQLLDGPEFSPDKATQLLGSGIGHITRLGGASNLPPAGMAQVANQIQRYLVEHTRLGIPAVIHEECCSGYMARGATVFPQAIGVASAWQPELVQEMADVIRRQMRSVGAHHALAPVLDITRDPRWGRVEETFGEDPYLTARLGAAYINGIQGDDLAQGVAATGKHFVGYGVSEGGLNWAPPHIAEREMRETYLFPFEAAVREAKVASIMNGYHELDGVPCGASKPLLTGILRDEWGFEGTVVSDYFAVRTLQTYHHIARDKAEASHLALDAGIDIELPFTDCYGEPLREAVASGHISEALVDTAVRRALIQKFELGLFENPYVDPAAVAFDTASDRALARKIAQQSIVLLRNEGGLLPLSKATESIAVIGPNADSVRHLFGDYAYPAHIETLVEMTQDNVFNQPLPQRIDGADDFITAVSILTAMREAVGSETRIEYAKGCEVNTTDTSGFAEAVEAARRAKVAVVVVGDKAGLADDCTSGEARDRAELTLPGVQAELVRAIHETGTPVVLVLINGRPLSLGWIAESVPAIVEAWFPSEEGGNAVADVLFGDVNPGGRLPMTFPRGVGQVPLYYNHPPSGGRSHWKGDYVESPVSPLYPFGYGLSYTRFEYSDLRATPSVDAADGVVTVQVDITNVGERAGDEVVQLYVNQTVPLVTRPVKSLKAFKRVTLAAGEQATVSFTLDVSQFAYYDAEYRLAVEPGTVSLMVGSSSADIRSTGSVEITGAKTLLAQQKAFFSREEATLAEALAAN